MITYEEVEERNNQIIIEFLNYFELEEYNTGAGLFYVNKEKNLLVGMRIFTTLRKVKNDFISTAWPHAIHITNIFVSEEYRGMGVFKSFVEKLHSFSYKTGYACIVFPSHYEFPEVFVDPYRSTIIEYRKRKKDDLVEMYKANGFFEIVTALNGKINTTSRRTRDNEYFFPLSRRESLGTNALAIDHHHVLPTMMNFELYKHYHKF